MICSSTTANHGILCSVTLESFDTRMVEEKGSHEREACREKIQGEGKPPKENGEEVAHGDVQSE